MRRSCILGLPRFRAVEVWSYHGWSPRSRKSASRYACTGRDTRTRGTNRSRRSRQRRRRWLPAFEELAIRLSSPRAMTRSASLTARRGSCSLLCTKSDPERRQVNEMTVGYERPSGDLGGEQPPRVAKAGRGKLGARSVQHLPHECVGDCLCPRVCRRR